MKKIINVNGTKMMMDEDGRLHPLTKEYYEINDIHPNNFAFKKPEKKSKIIHTGNIFNALDNKTVKKSTTVEKIMINEVTMAYLENNPKERTKLYNDYGLHSVDHIINPDISDNYMYIFYDDNRYELIAVGKNLKKRKHFAEKLLGDDE